MRCRGPPAPSMLARRMLIGEGERRSAAVGCRQLPWILITLLFPAALHGPSSPLFVSCACARQCSSDDPGDGVCRCAVCSETHSACGTSACRHGAPTAHCKLEASCQLEHTTRQLRDYSDPGCKSAVGAPGGEKMMPISQSHSPSVGSETGCGRSSSACSR